MDNTSGINDIIIRDTIPDDAAALAAIYAPYVLHTAVTFEYEPPTPDEMRGRIARHSTKYPYLVAEGPEGIIGFAYASVFRPRPAYDEDVEVTIYISGDHRGSGIGRMLYEELEQRLSAMGIRNMYACIATIDEEDEHLTKASPAFHERMGFKAVGTFSECGKKFGRYYDMTWYEKRIPHIEARLNGSA